MYLEIATLSSLTLKVPLQTLYQSQKQARLAQVYKKAGSE
jgi:hypothetical protein